MLLNRGSLGHVIKQRRLGHFITQRGLDHVITHRRLGHIIIYINHANSLAFHFAKGAGHNLTRRFWKG